MKGLKKLISWWLILSKEWLFVLASSDSRSTLCWFQRTLRYTSISKNARWYFLKNRWRVWFFRRGLSKPLNNARPHSLWSNVLVVCLLCRFGATSLRHVHCLFVWVFATIYGNDWYCYHWTSFVNPISTIARTVTPHRGNDVLSTSFCKGYISISTSPIAKTFCEACLLA